MHGLLPTPCEHLPIPHSSGAPTWDSDESPRYVPENVRDIMTLVNLRLYLYASFYFEGIMLCKMLYNTW